MKNLFLKVVSGVALIALLSFYGCNKEDDYDFEIENLRNVPSKVNDVDEPRVPVKKLIPMPESPIRDYSEFYPQLI